MLYRRLLIVLVFAALFLGAASIASAQGAAPSTQAALGPTTTYCVQYGDTLYSIAKRYNTTVDAIKNVNNLPSDTIYAGQCLIIPLNAPPTPSTDVIVDDLSPGFVRGGDPAGWYQQNIGYLDHSYWSYNNQVDQPDQNWGRWYPVLKPGYYEVYAFIPAQNAFAKSAKYTIRTADGYPTRIVNQSLYYNQWVSLGTYRFNGDGNEYVYLNDATGEPRLSVRLAWDAVKWSPR
ncbi:MAG: LysM peptidoglycan-binding domain-containing protein [Anaerolineae bacterium]